MPGLIRGVARTAVIAGTASAVNGRVQRRQAEKFAARDADIYASRQAAYAQQAPPQEPVYAVPAYTPPPPPSSEEVIKRLNELGDLHERGVLTDSEFNQQKAKLLGS